MVRLVQETKLRAGCVAEQSQKLAKAGWKSFWAPALGDSDKRASAGVCVVAEAYSDVREPHTFEAVVEPGRIQCVLWASRELGTVCVYNLYAESGTGAGVRDRNLDRLVRIKRHAYQHGLPYIVGGDFNLDAEEVDEFLRGVRYGARVCHDAQMPTCWASDGGSSIDFFVVDLRLSPMVGRTCVDLAADSSPHKPTDLWFRGDVSPVSSLPVSTAPNAVARP